MRMRNTALVRMLMIVGLVLGLSSASAALAAAQDDDGPPCIPVTEIEDGLDNDCDGDVDDLESTERDAGEPVAFHCVDLADLAAFDPNTDDVLTSAELEALADQYPDNASLQGLGNALDEQGIAAIQYQGCMAAVPEFPCIDQPGLAVLDPNTDDILTIAELQAIAEQFPDISDLADIVAQAEQAGLSGIQYQGCAPAGTPTPLAESVTVPSGPCQDAVESAQAGEGDFANHELRFVALGESGGAGDQVIIGTELDDIIDAGSGNDLVCGLGGNDVIAGGSGDDQLIGNEGDDTILGGSGEDTCDGMDGANEITACEN